MARPSSKHPTELELEILKTLWGEGPLRVQQVRDALVGFRDLAYSSVTTIMNIMVDKKYLSRRKDGPSFVYKPRVSRTVTTERMLKDVVDRAFDGSAAAVMLRLLETSELGKADTKKIRSFLDRQTRGTKR